MRFFRWVKSLFSSSKLQNTSPTGQKEWVGEYFHCEEHSPEWLKDTCKFANLLMADEEFWKLVNVIPSFDYSDKSGLQVTQDLRQHFSCQVKLWTPRNPWSAAIATTFAGDPNVYFSTRKNPRPMAEMVNTLIHERCHKAGYGHGSNSPVGKEHSVPYGVGQMAEDYMIRSGYTV